MGDDNEKKEWGKTTVIRAIKDAVGEAPPPQDISESRLPLRVVAGLVCFAVVQCLTIAGVYYDLREQVNSLADDASAISLVEITELKLRLSQLEKDAKRVEQSMLESPTVLDNMRRVGELNADVRELKARVEALERRRD